MKTLRVLLAVAVVFASFAFVPVPKKAEAYIGWMGINGSIYNPSLTSQPSDINASRNSGDSWWQSMEIDSNGNPHLVWMDNTLNSSKHEIFYIHWDGANWVGANGSIYNPSANPQPFDINVSRSILGTSSPCIQLDKNNNPHISWAEAGPLFDTYYVKWNGMNWVGANNSIFDPSISSQPKDINVTSSAGVRDATPLFDLDSKGFPHFVWSHNENYGIYYIKWNGSDWTGANGSTYNPSGAQPFDIFVSRHTSWNASPQIVVDRNDLPHIVYHDNAYTGFDIIYLKWDINVNNWVGAGGNIYNPSGAAPADINVSRSSRHDLGPSLSLDSNLRPHITWTYSTHGAGDDQIFYVKWNGTNWIGAAGSIYNPATAYNVSDINVRRFNSADNPGWSHIEVDSKDIPHISWSDVRTGQHELMYVKWNGSNWQGRNNSIYTPTQNPQPSDINVSSNTGNSTGFFRLDKSDHPNFILVDNAFGGGLELIFLKWGSNYDGSFTLTKSVDTNNDGDYSDSGKQVNVGDTLKYKINWKFNQGQDPLEEPYLYDTIPEGTHYVAGSASTNANLSYSLDGGTTWIAGEPPNGSPAGTQLRWDLSSLWVGAAGSPYISSAATQPMDINLSRTTTPSGFNVPLFGQASERVKIDSKGYPNIVWVESIFGNWEISFAKWNGNSWVNIQSTIYNPSSNNANISNTNTMSILPELALDKNDYPYICWSEGTSINTTDIWFIKWNGLNWVNSNNTQYDPLSNNANISNNFGWSNFATIRLDSNNRPHIAWDDKSYGSFGREIMYAWWNGISWVNIQNITYDPISGNAKVSNTPGESCDPSFDLDSNGNPFISWNESSTSFALIHWNGSNWLTINNILYNPSPLNALLPFTIGGTGNTPRIQLGKDGYPRLCWLQFIGDAELCFIKWDGSNWDNIDNSPYNTSINNHNITNDIYYSWWGDFILDDNDNPHFIWQNAIPSNDEICYIYYDGKKLVTANGSIYDPLTSNANISTNTGISTSPALTIDQNNYPNVIWLDNSSGNDEIYYMKLSAEKSFTFSVQVDNPPATPAFCNEATFRHKWDNGKATLSNTVCNTIDYNFTGKFELKKSVENSGDGKYDDDGKEAKAGDRLNYKIDWSFDNPNSDPLFDTYVYDTIPEGTTYVAGSATSDMLSHSTDNGATWIAGEPQDSAPAGTRLRWKIPQPGWTNAKGLIVNSTNPNVSNNTGISDFPSLQLDPITKYPCIAWSDDVSGTTLVYFIKWNGNQWTNAAGLPFTIANGNVGNIPGGDPTLTLDPLTGYPWIAFQSNAILFSNLEIHIVKWDGTQWTNAAGAPVTLLNSNVSNNAGLSWYPSHQLALDSNRYPGFVWKDNSSGSWQSYYARWNGLNWVNVTGAILNATNGSLGNNIVDPSFWPTLVLDSNDNPCIAWDSNITGNSEIYFAKWNGVNWVNINGLPLTPTNGNVSNNTGSSLIPYLAIDKQTNNPSIVWSDNTPGNYEIYFARWDGSAWVNASGANLTSTNGNISNNPGNSSLLSMVYDATNLPCISWEDDTPGNSEIFFVRWNGTNWVDALGNGFTGSNGLVNSSPGRSWFPSVAVNKQTGNPSIAWLDRTPGNNEVYFAQWNSYKKTFNFSVRINNPFNDYLLSPICNKAEFWHVFDKGNHTKSNSVCNSVYKKPEETKKAKLRITKKAFKFTLGPKDVVHFAVEIENIGDVDAIDVNIYDYFPKELEIYHSIPKGEIGGSSIRYFLELLKAGHKRRFEVMFKVSKSAKIGKDGLYLTNIAKAFSKNSESAVEASATVVIRNDTPSGNVSMNLQMMGVDAKTGVCKKGTEISIKVDPEGGTPPYDIIVDWGDGTQSKAFNVTTDKPPTLTHTYNEAGEYTITIICTDQYGNVCKIIRKVKVE